MAHLLHVSASPRRERSVSRRIGNDLIGSLRGVDPRLLVRERNLALDLPPHPGDAFATASTMPDAQRGPMEQAALALSEQLIGELEETELVVVSTPMHNFTVPSTLKAWIDHVVRPGRTFRSTAAGKLGLLKDRPVLIVITCGGRCGEAPAGQTDFITPYLRYVFAMIGLSSVEALRLDEFHRSAEPAEQRRRAACGWIDLQCRRLASTLRGPAAGSPDHPAP